MTWSADISCHLNGTLHVERNIDLAGATYYLLPETKFTITMYVGLLLPNDIEALQFSDMTDSRVVGSERVDGFDCFVLESKQWRIRFWVDKNIYALRKTFEWDPSWVVCKYHPELGAKVHEREFSLGMSDR